MRKTETEEEKDMFQPEIMIKLNYRDDERNWGTLLLVLAFLPSLVFFSFLSAACLLPRADPISHTLTRTHSASHTHSRRSATVPMPKHHPHGHVQSPSSSSPLLSFSLSCSFTASRLVKVAHAHSHGRSHMHSPRHGCTH